jgi:hypothetical protein
MNTHRIRQQPQHILHQPVLVSDQEETHLFREGIDNDFYDDDDV